MDFIENGILSSLRFHRCSTYESGCPALSQLRSEGGLRMLC
jgi:hypothetical protein